MYHKVESQWRQDKWQYIDEKMATTKMYKQIIAILTWSPSYLDQLSPTKINVCDYCNPPKQTDSILTAHIFITLRTFAPIWIWFGNVQVYHHFNLITICYLGSDKNFWRALPSSAAHGWFYGSAFVEDIILHVCIHVLLEPKQYINELATLHRATEISCEIRWHERSRKISVTIPVIAEA